MEYIQKIRAWFHTLPTKEQTMVSGAGVLIVITLFYLAIWEPMHLSFSAQQQTNKTQTEILAWMQQAAAEVATLGSAGTSQSTIRDTDKPTTLVVEQTINNAGLKPAVGKIESSGNNGARVTLNDVSFNQMLIWLNTMSIHNGIQVTSANIERGSKTGTANARLTLERP